MKKGINTNGMIQILSKLIETCHSGQQGFAEVANSQASAAIKNFCAEQSRLRAQFSADLHEEMRGLISNSGVGEGQIIGTAADFTWFNAVERSEDSAIIAACKSGNDAAIKQYEEALTHPLPAPVRSVIEYQCSTIKQAQDQIKAWDGSGGT